MRKIFDTLMSWSQASSGNSEFKVVTSVHTQNISSSTISRVHGIFFSSFDISIANIVVSATTIANGSVVAKPQRQPVRVHEAQPAPDENADPRPS